MQTLYINIQKMCQFQENRFNVLHLAMTEF